MLDELARLAAGFEVPPLDAPPLDYTFHYPMGFLLDTWHLWREHGITPDGQPYLDQPVDLVADWRYLTRYYNWAHDDAIRARMGKAAPRDGVDALVQQFLRDTPHAPMGWEDLTQ